MTIDSYSLSQASSVLLISCLLFHGTNSFITQNPTTTSTTFSHQRQSTTTSSLYVFGSTKNGLTDLPKDISPFEKSSAKKRDVQGDIRKLAEAALTQGLQDGKLQMEIECPPVIGVDQSKTQFDDFDNIQELDRNKDWTMLLAPMFLGEFNMLMPP